MAKPWQLKLIRPKDKIVIAVRNAWALALGDLETWIARELVPAMVFGGKPGGGSHIQGIAETEFYQFISSHEGLSQLGIDPGQPPRLLQAYETKAFKVSKNRTMVYLRFGDVAELKLATPHPANGTGNLHIESWLEWIIDQKKVDSGFVPRSSVPGGARRAIRLEAPLGGLMVPKDVFGSKGRWQVPRRFANYDVKWLKRNLRKIEQAMIRQMVRFLQARLK